MDACKITDRNQEMLEMHNVELHIMLPRVGALGIDTCRKSMLALAPVATDHAI